MSGAKLQTPSREELLALYDKTPFIQPRFNPHLLFAKLDVEHRDSARMCMELVKWCQSLGLRWSAKKSIEYLHGHQEQFRLALQWLEGNAYLDLRACLGQNLGKLTESKVLKSWQTYPQARFLQQHGLKDAGVVLRPANLSDKPSLSLLGIHLCPGRPQDPLDPICWHLLWRLSQEGRLSIRRCGDKRCPRYFEPKTRRRRYCSDLCRAKANAKSREDMRDYMRSYRATTRRPKIHVKKRKAAPTS